MYRVFIPTKNRQTTIRTHRQFPAAWVTVVVHTEAQREAYLDANMDLMPHQVVVSGVPADAYGLTRQREWICGHLALPHEWFVFADDNIARLTAVPAPAYWQPVLDVQADPLARPMFNLTPTADWLETVFADTIAQCIDVGAHLAGCAVVDNPFFRTRKFRTVGYVSGKLMLWHNRPFAWDHTVTMEDFRNTAWHLLHYGAVVINNFVFPVAGHYEPGGMGTAPERLPYRTRDVQVLQARYPGLFRVKPSAHPDLSLRLTRRKQVAAWRQVMAAHSRPL